MLEAGDGENKGLPLFGVPDPAFMHKSNVGCGMIRVSPRGGK
jgi:hypothetical protein